MPELIHTSFWVADIDRTLAFYKLLGFQVHLGGEFRGIAQFAFIGLPGDGPRIELNQLNDGPDSYDVGNGYRHIAITLDDIDATLAALAVHGYEPNEPPEELPETPGIRMCFIRDPDGYELELWSPRGPEFPPPPES